MVFDPFFLRLKLCASMYVLLSQIRQERRFVAVTQHKYALIIRSLLYLYASL